MNQQDAGRIAFGVVLGVVGAVAITKSGLNPQESILRWLIFALVTGVLVNTQDGKKLPFILTAAALSALGLIATVLWLALLGEGVIPSLSGVKIDLAHRPLFGTALLSGLWLVSAVAVLVCALSRPVSIQKHSAREGSIEIEGSNLLLTVSKTQFIRCLMSRLLLARMECSVIRQTQAGSPYMD